MSVMTALVPTGTMQDKSRKTSVGFDLWTPAWMSLNASLWASESFQTNTLSDPALPKITS
ncbi:hypothetical protein G6M01_07980 [Agrobacterium tumefaciens]|nr:hypothetical protein [Agrobacterium tumefaciens]